MKTFNNPTTHPIKVFSLALLTSMVIACGGEQEASSVNPNTESEQAKSVTISILVKNHTGVPLANSEVKIGKLAAVTDKLGMAKIAVPSHAKNTQILDVVLDGYVRQSLQFIADDDKTLQAILLPVKSSLTITQIENAQTLSAGDLGATVTLPENALIKLSDGTPATGAAKVEITPWNITNNDLFAMPANGQAIASDNTQVELISAGMMTVDFHDDEGNALQLADGKKATITMDLPQTSINNQTLSVGSKIPLWHYDEDAGIWKEDGKGNVIASANSPSGLAVTAQVSHFSTWNWDFKRVNGGSVDIECVVESGNTIPCNVMADVTLPDNSRFTKQNNIPSTGATIINMPTSASISWTGTAAGGLTGSAQSGSSGQVVINIGTPKTDNFVQCVLPDATPTACNVTLNGLTGETRSLSIPAQGAQVRTMFDATSLTWQGKTQPIIVNNELRTHNSSVLSSGISGNVTIQLNPQTPIARTMSVGCLDAQGTPKSCKMTVKETLANGSTQTTEYKSYGPANTPHAVNVTINNNTLSYEIMASTQVVEQNGRLIASSKQVNSTQVVDQTLTLDSTTDIGAAARTVRVKCTKANPTINIDSCDLQFNHLPAINKPVGQEAVFNLPSGLNDGQMDIVAMAKSGTSHVAHTFELVKYSTITENQLFDLVIQ